MLADALLRLSIWQEAYRAYKWQKRTQVPHLRRWYPELQRRSLIKLQLDLRN